MPSHGTETEYKLNLEDTMDFPDSAHVPAAPPKPGESWIIFGEIVRDNSSTCPVFIIKDKIDDDFPVVFHTKNPVQDATACKIGHILCITSGMRVPFSRDGGSLSGYVITDPSTVFVLPCSMAQLRALNKCLRDKNDRGEMDLCNSCKKASTERCSKCQTPYCSRECQAADWKEGGHRKECPVIARLHIWNRTDWG